MSDELSRRERAEAVFCNAYPTAALEKTSLAEVVERLRLTTNTLAYLQGEDWETIKGNRALLATLEGTEE